ncbi:MAG: hypothetical protein CVV27_07310 [Candidatus Melainabacteria bacterium HGW-Melainabacteria-1]|nr:MAG: hypothetical protein CVV27_07310 [Candidatus Melainabacteria bacterium HGW-Melainabacteria-1]
MWNNRNTLITLLALAQLAAPMTITAPVLAQGPPVEQVPAARSVVLEGQILDGRSGAPLQGVYIRQREALNAVFSDSQGRFRLELASGFAPMVLFQAEGYETVSLPFSAGQDRLRIHLQPLLNYSSDLPPAHSPVSEAFPERIFGPQFTLFYQGNYTLFRQADVSINGLVINEFGISTDLMPFYPLVFRGRFFRSRLPVDVANFPFTPAFFINHQQAKVGAGWVQQLEGPFEIYLGADVMLDSRSPDNRSNQDQQPVAFTGSLLDLEQNRLGFGLNAALGWKLSERLSLFPEASLYPLTVNFVTQNSPHLMLAGDLGAKLRFEIIPGVYAIGSYNTQLWYSFGPGAFENNHFLHLGVSLDPWSLAERLL